MLFCNSSGVTMMTIEKMHWVPWWKMCIHKEIGGMGFRDRHTFNTTMLAKKFGGLCKNQIPFCVRVVRANIIQMVTC
jgi:hypothetical protein